MAIKIMYAVLCANGDLKRRKRQYSTRPGSLYESKQAAQNFAYDEGDSVVRVRLDFEEEPVFIRTKTLNPEE